MQEHERWLDFAEEAFKFIKVVHEIPNPPHTRMMLFYAREGAERSLKTFLVFKKVEGLLKTRNLSHLINNCAKIDSDFLQLKASADNLHQYYCIEYPDHAVSDPDISLAEDAIERAKNILEFVKEKLNV